MAFISIASIIRKIASGILDPIRLMDSAILGIQSELEYNENLLSELNNFEPRTRIKFQDKIYDLEKAIRDLKMEFPKLKPLLKDPSLLEKTETAAKKILDKANTIAEEGEFDKTTVNEIETIRKDLSKSLAMINTDVLPTIPTTPSKEWPELEALKFRSPEQKVRRRWFMRKKSYCISEHLRLAAAEIMSTSAYIPHRWPQVGDAFGTWMKSVQKVLTVPTLLEKIPEKLLENIETSLSEYIDLFRKEQDLEVTTGDLKQIKGVIEGARHPESGRSKELSNRAGKLIPKILKRVSDFTEELRSK